LTYLVSFAFIGIYWNNHHHMLHAAARIDGRVLWANLHLLFWLSLVPFVTGWVGQDVTAPVPTALYGVVLLMSGIAWLILQRSLVTLNGRDSHLARAIGGDVKGKVSAVLYSAAIVLSFVRTRIADAIYVLVAAMWLVPDPRIERTLSSAHPPAEPKG
jgi:uncharacterized membrane protein